MMPTKISCDVLFVLKNDIMQYIVVLMLVQILCRVIVLLFYSFTRHPTFEWTTIERASFGNGRPTIVVGAVTLPWEEYGCLRCYDRPVVLP